MIYSALRQSLNAKGAETIAQIVLRDDEAIELAHEMSDGMGLASAEIYAGILAGEAEFAGRKLVVAE